MPAPSSIPPNWRFPLRHKTPATILRGIGHAFVAPFVSQSTFAIADYQVTVPSRSLFARQLAKYQAYEPLNSNWIISQFRETNQGLFIDVGANFGWFSLLTARLAPAATIIALEPSRENFSLLTQNIASSHFTNIAALNKGAGASSIQASLYAHEHDNPGAHSIRKSTGVVSEETVSIEPLDSLLSTYSGPVNLLKIDVEGYEIEALLGAAETLRRTSFILLEYSPSFLQECGREPTQLLEILKSRGFKPHLVRETGLESVALHRLEQRDPDLAQGHRWQVDLVFTRL